MLNEADTRAKLIDLKLHQAGWDESLIAREYYLTEGRINLVGDRPRREERRKVDYLLRYTNSFPIAVVEAKDESHSPLDGIQQAKDYAQALGLIFAYSTNGHKIEEFDFTTNQERSLTDFPPPESLWQRYEKWQRGIKPTLKAPENPLLYPYYYEPGARIPRYYQEAAINRIIEAILAGQSRILLTMATGTGKTFVAFQVVWKLVKSGYFKRVLYIADRLFLRDQAHNNEFYPFRDARAIIEGGGGPKDPGDLLQHLPIAL
jgi:type I restriction enzyme R subunit